MSIEEDVELRDLVTQSLELNGCLGKIRAQLRANLFLALDEDVKISSQQPLLNKKLQKSLETPEGKLMFSVVREFLEFFNLDFTISVFEPESSLGQCYQYDGRQKIMEDLTLEDGQGPLLLELIKIAQRKKPHVNNMDSTAENHNDSMIVNGLNSTYAVNKPTVTGQKDSTSVATDLGELDDVTTNGHLSEDSILSCHSSPETNKSKSDDSKQRKKAKLELPPLQLNKNRVSDILPSLYYKDFKEKHPNVGFDIREDYEEDFMSGSELDFSSSKNQVDHDEKLTNSNNATTSVDNTGSDLDSK